MIDISQDVLELRDHFSHALSDMENGQDSPLNIDSNKQLNRSEALVSLTEYINGEQYTKAIQLLRSFR